MGLLVAHEVARRAHLRNSHYPGNVTLMSTVYSKLTAQGQISVPAKIRRKLGLHPGSTLEWEEDGERVVVRRSGRYTFDDIHRSLFERPPKAHSLAELKQGLGQHARARHARR